MLVQITQPGVYDQFGIAQPVGSTPDLEGDLASSLIRANKATDKSGIHLLPPRQVFSKSQMVLTKLDLSVNWKQLVAAATTFQIPLFKLPAKAFLAAIWMYPLQSFAGPSITAVTASVGTVATPAQLASAFDVLQAPGDTVIQGSSNFQMYSYLNPTQIYLQAIATGANLAALTQGVLVVEAAYWEGL